MSASDLQRKLQSKLPPIPPLIPHSPNAVSAARNKRRDFTPIEWTEFFDERRSVLINSTDSFNVYVKGTNENNLKFLLLHGAGYSGLTWACFAEELCKIFDCQLFAPDLRGHGGTSTSNDEDLAIDTQISDVISIVQHMFSSTSNHTPTLFVIGHSMGGALAARVCQFAEQNKSFVVQGLCVIDVVEGSAMDALQCMTNVLRARPTAFTTKQKAIEWCMKSGTVRNQRSARVSMPAQLREVSESEGITISSETMLEEGGEEAAATMPAFTWRIDLMKTQPYWRGWFDGLSKIFLSVNAPKLLLLAGVDRLDTDLTVGQMQGKFQMVVLPKVGHCVQEDSPDKVADTIASFCVRHKFATAKCEFQPVYPGC